MMEGDVDEDSQTLVVEDTKLGVVHTLTVEEDSTDVLLVA